MPEKTKSEPAAEPSAFVQIAAGNWNHATMVFALDAAGHVWQCIPGRDNEWSQLPDKRGEILLAP